MSEVRTILSNTILNPECNMCEDALKEFLSNHTDKITITKIFNHGKIDFHIQEVE